MATTINITLLILSIILLVFLFLRYFPLRDFTKMLSYIHNLDIPIQDELLYVHINHWKEYHHIFYSELEINFQLFPERNISFDYMEYTGGTKDHIYDDIVEPRQEQTGKQVFFYTFRSNQSLENRLADFISFVQEEYISDAEHRRQNEFYWSRFESGR